MDDIETNEGRFIAFLNPDKDQGDKRPAFEGTLSLAGERDERRTGRDAAAAELHGALGLDMVAHWTATADGYFAKLTKAQILAAVREEVSEDAARRLEGLKKTEMAKAAEAMLAGRG